MRIRSFVRLVALIALTAAAPLSPTAAAGEPGAETLPIYLEGDGLIVGIEAVDPVKQSVRGRLMLKSDVFPFTAESLASGSSRGTFEAGGKRYPFTMTSQDGQVFVLESGGSTYRLKRVARPSRAFPGGAPDGGATNEPGAQPGTPPGGEVVPGLPSGFEVDKNGSLGSYTRQFSQVYSLLAAMPAVTNLTAPDWVKPGVKITFWTGSATIQDQAGQTTLKPDPNGDLVDSSGQHYSQSSVAGGSGAVGFTQIDIIGVSKDIVVMQSSNFLHDGSIQAPALMSVTPFTCHPSGCEWWIHPTALKMMAAQGGFAFAGKWSTNGQVRDVIAVRDGAGSTIYDAESGILLSWSNQAKNTGTETYYDPATQTSQVRAKSGSTLAVSQFRSVRTTYRSELAGMPLPSAALSFKGIEARVSRTMDMQTGMGPSPLEDTTVRIEPVLNAGNWLVLKLSLLSMSTSGMPVPMEQPRSMLLISTPAVIGSTFLPTGFLAGLKEGQVLDRDPLTGYTVSVSQIGRGGNGRQVVAIASGGRTEQTTYYYDRESGLMTSSDKIDRGAALQRTIAQVTKTW